MRKLLLLIIIVFLAGCKTSSDMVSSSGYFDTGGSTTYQDKDWNVEFYDNCGLPESSSVKWVTEGKETFLRFTLKNNQVGGCGRDGIARARAPYWERAEVKQTSTLDPNKSYTLTFKIRFNRGYSFNREDFLQLHQDVSGCRVGPILMFKFSESFLRTNDWMATIKKSVDIDDLRGRWIDVRLDVTPSKTYDFYLDGDKLIENGRVRFQKCGEPYLKIGIYRPGDEKAEGDRISVVDYDKIWLAEKK